MLSVPEDSAAGCGCGRGHQPVRRWAAAHVFHIPLSSDAQQGGCGLQTDAAKPSGVPEVQHRDDGRGATAREKSVPRSGAEQTGSDAVAASDNRGADGGRSIPIRASGGGGKGDEESRAKSGDRVVEDGKAKANEKRHGSQEGGGSRSGVFEDERSAGAAARTGGGGGKSDDNSDGRREDGGDRARAEDAAATESGGKSSRENAAAGGVTDDVAADDVADDDGGNDAEYEDGGALSDGSGAGQVIRSEDAERRGEVSDGWDSLEVEADADSTRGRGTHRWVPTWLVLVPRYPSLVSSIGQCHAREAALVEQMKPDSLPLHVSNHSTLCFRCIWGAPTFLVVPGLEVHSE